MDVLSRLRAAVMEKSAIDLLTANGDATPEISAAVSVRVGDQKFPLDQLTSYSTPDSSAAAGGGTAPLNLASVLYAYLNRQRNYAEYFQDCQKIPSIRHVSIVVRSDLVEYLTGAKDHSDYIVSVAAADRVDNQSSSSALAGDRDIMELGDEENRGERIMNEMERSLTDRTSVLVTNGRSFVAHRQLAIDHILKGISSSTGPGLHPSSKKPRGDKRVSSSSGAGDKKSSSSIKIQPIIIVSAAVTSLITLYNVHQFLSGNRFKPTDTVRKRDPRKPSHVKLEKVHERTGQAITYTIVESIQNIEDWDRVVAVFCGGQEWQFRGWKWQEPVELFHNVRGFYVKYTDARVEPAVSKWNVTVLEVNRYKRHLDTQSVHLFWTELEQWIAVNKPRVLQ
eukprot:Partr_v1_DN28284_c1_g4_i6_m75279 putative cell division cycle 73, Paf1 RNA polymerase II complex component, homolog (S. cerevisiae)